MRNWVGRIFTPAAGKPDHVPMAKPDPADLQSCKRNADDEFERRDFAAAGNGYRQVLAIEPENVAALCKLGFALKELGQLDEARTVLLRALALDATRADIHFFLGEIANAEGKAEQARTYWTRTIELASDIEPAYIGLCRLLYRDGLLDPALHVALDGIRHHPQSAEMHFWLGNLHYGKQDFDLAEQSYRNAIGINSDSPDYLANLGLLLAGQGKNEQAVEVLKQSLALEPYHPMVQNNLANALFKTGSFDEACAVLARSVAMDPAYVDNWNEWGLALHSQHRPGEAIECFRQFLQGKPAHIPARFALANLLHASQQWDDATRNYLAILDLDPARIEVLCNLGINSLATGDSESAAGYYRRALALRPDYADANFNLGTLLHGQGKLDEAIAHYRNALASYPELAAARLNLANAYRTLEKWSDAQREYEHLLRIAPGNFDALFNFGVALQSQGHYDDAISRYREALTIAPTDHNLLLNLGSALTDTGQFAAAAECFENVLHANPHSVEARINMAALLSEQGQLAESVALCDQALAIAPDNPDAHYSRGLALLRMGDFEAGWQGYEYRWDRANASKKRSFPTQDWRGDTSLHGKTIFLYTEQGLGDTIQFVRLIDRIAAAGARIILEVQAPLLPLLKQLQGVEHFVIHGSTDPMPAFDLQCALLSLPAAFKSDFTPTPCRYPYVHAPSDRVAHWKAQLAQAGSPKIGLVWAGNPLHKNDRNRSASLASLAPLWSGTNRRFHSLQKDVPARDAALLQGTPSVVDLSSFLTDFAETAAILSCLDLLITVDSSLAHLAGAMGVPVWIMLPYLPDFRWMMERRDSPWYPSARLFRQSGAGDWASIVNAIDEALTERFGAATRPD